MAKHGINQEKSGEGSAPNETRVGQSMENGNKDPGSKNASKEGNVGWSRCFLEILRKEYAQPICLVRQHS